MTGDEVNPVAGWSRLHGEDVSASRLVVGWLRLVHALARPLDRVHPDLVSAAGVLVAGGAVAAAGGGGRWPLLALLLVVSAGVLDGLDGAVALRTGRVRPLGAVVDAVADRLSDLSLVLVLLVLGAEVWWCAAIGAAVLLHEYARAKAQGVGMTSAGAITAAERPTRVIVVAVACAGAGLAPGGTPGTGWSWAAVSALVWAGCAAVGFGQLAAGIRRELTGRPWADPVASGRSHQAGDDLR
ncbi:CDP-diacylglycerol--glycerol-3-phosphate 3-phosphatidyltransferase [Lentzea xinjiangensis]|uniref:CDP-diacylglycerol--glycerol-3-phosphate 3-phosphatidyltransferase n=1 Tax=Lentzea xinjiangensis TaxID=402600 RepID=A0A1H9K715_9PSEU|nr:CDP-alcohol phosphatidyltransferase family protein [Lentzea xinjiangensis]SEQ94950.1 CDP-diacylglycerol--glycerol-3-phosphate 3-phosphatidyltransferase [Lentzea xinjiangensis]